MYMMNHSRGITQRDAFKMGVYRLGARIWDLKAAGYKIKTLRQEVTNADGSTSRIARYVIDDRE